MSGLPGDVTRSAAAGRELEARKPPCGSFYLAYGPIKKSEEGLFVLGFTGIYRTADGDLFEEINAIQGTSSLTLADLKLQFLKYENGYVWAGDNPSSSEIALGAVALYRLIPGQTAWERAANSGFPGNATQSSAEDISYDSTTGRYFVASGQGGVYVSTNGLDWMQQTNGLPGTDGETVVAHNGTAVLALKERGIFRSTDGGASWWPTSAPVGKPGDLVRHGERVVFVLNGLAAQAGGTYFSDDLGANWTRISGPSGTDSENEWDITTDGTVLHAASATHRITTVRFSTDSGLSWNVIPTPGVTHPVFEDIGVTIVRILRHGARFLALESSAFTTEPRLFRSPTIAEPFLGAIQVVKHPESASVFAGRPHTFEILAGGANPTFQWQRMTRSSAFSDMAGATGRTLQISRASTNDAGSYRCVVSGNGSSVASNPAMLIVASKHDPATAAILIKDINQQRFAISQPRTLSSELKLFTSFGDALFFAAHDGYSGFTLWRSDGTTEGTRFVRGFRDTGGNNITEILAVRDRLYFKGGFPDYSGVDYFQSDGTAGGTMRVQNEFRVPPFDGGNTLYFRNSEGLWRSDSPALPSSLVRSFPLPADVRDRLFSSEMARVGNRLFFIAHDPSTGAELWKSDGTPESTVLVKDIQMGTTTRSSGPRGNPGEVEEVPNSSFPTMLVGANDLLFFTATDGTNNGLWRSDGTSEGTIFLKGDGAAPLPHAELNGQFFFTAGTLRSLWKTDGTLVGTALVKDVRPLAMVTMNGKLFFIANNGLWISDGSPAGTLLLKSGLFSLRELVVAGGMLYFTASDSAHGDELWKSDGTAEGTTLAADVVPGPTSSSPTALTAAGDKLFFKASRSDVGFELFAIELDRIEPPRLTVSHGKAPTSVVVSWSLSFPDWVLETTATPASAASWTAVPNTPVAIGDALQMSVVPDETQRYFRLRR